MRMRTIVWLVAVFVITYSTLRVMVNTVKPILGSVNAKYNPRKSITLARQRERFYKRQEEEMIKITQDQDILDWKLILDDFDIFQLVFPSVNESNATITAEMSLQVPSTRDYDYIQTKDLCGLSRAFQRYRDSVMYQPASHVLWWREPTDGDDPMLAWQEAGCNLMDLFDYLDHNDTLAVMITRNTTGVQLLNHPKLFPIAVGLWQDKTDTTQQQLYEEIHSELKNARNRTLPVLVVGVHTHTTRTMEVKDRLMRRFGKVKVMYHPRLEDHQLLYNNFLHSKFVLGVTGGDHDWITEAMALGAIPILEEDNQHNSRTTTNGYHPELLANLPLVWIDDYDNLTPELLEMEFAGILHDEESFRYERLTQQYWIDKALRELEEMDKLEQQEEEELSKLQAKQEHKKKKGIFHNRRS